MPLLPATSADPELRPLCLLLMPRALEGFLLRDQAQDLLRAPGVVAVDPPSVPYGALGRLPGLLADLLASGQARRLVRTLARDARRSPDAARGGVPRVVVIFHPLQYILARAIIAQAGGDCELWYGRWDRYENAYDAGPRMRARLTELHEQAAGRARITFVASEALAEIERSAGREATLVPLSADGFPAPDPLGGRGPDGERRPPVVAVSLGHLGWRTDWALLHEVSRRMPELVLLLIGAWHDDECAQDPDYAACRSAPNLVWLGAQDDEAAARLILCADVGIIPFKVEPFNDAGLPFRILKYALLGRRTVSPPLAGAQTWGNAVTFAPDAHAFVAALRAAAGTRAAPDVALREWALQQTAVQQNAPLWERLREAGIDVRGT
ncbi:MAG: glycosyltransferase family 4 protein [Solirubrobacterales bacterium]|nr:glycosyltransferase family 4 protein [Solirubrobacterales bacterium]